MSQPQNHEGLYECYISWSAALFIRNVSGFVFRWLKPVSYGVLI